MSVREYAVLYVGKSGKAGDRVVGGGNVVLAAKPHALAGPEHTGQLPIERLSTVSTDPTLVVAPNGAGALELRAGAPTTADYLVGTAQAGLSAEIVVGAAPGGELGGTWASPTVDATHSGTSHAAAQAAAEATAAGALSTHAGAADPHTGYQRESEKGAASGYASLGAGGLVPIAQVPTGTSGTTVSFGNHVHHGAWSDATAYIPGDMVSLDGASWVCVLANTALRPFPPDYRKAMVSTTPLSYWRLGEASGTVAVDEMGASNGTYVGSPTLGVAGLLTGDSDTAVTLVASPSPPPQYITVPSLTVPTAAITLLAWSSLVNAADDKGILGQWSSTGAVLYSYSNSIRLLVNGNSVTVAAPASGQHLYAGTWDGTNGRVYIDGVLVGGPTALAGPITVPAVGFAMGAYVGGLGSGLAGALDEPAIWNRAVTPAEIAGLNAVGTGTVVWRRLTPPATYLNPATATANQIVTALIAAGLMAAS